MVKQLVSANTSIHVYEGFDEIKEYYFLMNESLEENDEVLVFGARSGNPHLPEALSFFRELIESRANRKVYTKLLFNRDHEFLAKRYANPYTSYKFMPLGLLTESGIDIYKDSMNILIWKHDTPRLILIQDSSVAESYRDYFNFMWSSANLIDKQIEKGTYWLPEVLFEAYTRHTNEKEVLRDSISELISTYNPKKVLEIGSGFGDVVKQVPPQTHYTVVEKNAGFHQTTSDSVVFIDSSWEDYETDKQFDVIIASHVIFYLKQDPEVVISSILDKLSPGGKAILVFNAPTGDYAELKKHIYYLKSEACSFTYEKFRDYLQQIILDEFDVESQVTTTSIDETYRILRFLFEDDLDVYLRNEKSIKEKIRILTEDKQFTITNRLVIISKS